MIQRVSYRQRLRDRVEHAGGLRSQAEALERASIAADREIALLKMQVPDFPMRRATLHSAV